MVSRVFDAMGTSFEMLVDAPRTSAVDEALDSAEREVRRLEGLLSRFDERSELSRLNREGRLDGGPELAEIVGLALDARDRTHGRFDPTVHDALVSAGYDRTFAEVGAASRDDDGRPGTTTPACGGTVELDRATGRIVLGDGVRLDLGGIAKGWTADRVAALLAPLGPALVNAGGDIAAHGRAWTVAVEQAGLTVAVTGGGLATSGTDRRRWVRDGVPAHHLIDPRTARPATGDLLTVTAFAPSAAAAETAATMLLLAGGVEAAVEEADASSIPAVLVSLDGRAHLAGGLA